MGVNRLAYKPNILIEVDCLDGSALQIVPQQLDPEGKLVPAAPNGPFVNTMVLLRKNNGDAVRSRGAGEVDVVTRFDAVALGGLDQALTSSERPNLYVGQCNENKIRMRDR